MNPRHREAIRACGNSGRGAPSGGARRGHERRARRHRGPLRAARAPSCSGSRRSSSPNQTRDRGAHSSGLADYFRRGRESGKTGHDASPPEPGRDLEFCTATAGMRRAPSTRGCSVGTQRRCTRAPGTTWALEFGDRIEGGVVERDLERPFWLPYVDVADVMEMTERARLLGASVLLSPREGPAGWRSILATPAGGDIALWQPKT